MSVQIKFLRKFKANFIRFRVHKLLGPLATPFVYIGYLTKLSRWVAQHRNAIPFDDFYNPRVAHADRTRLYETVANAEKLNKRRITYLEFGVGHGHSLRWWTEANSEAGSTFFAFDTFEGLPETWGAYEKGRFSRGGNVPAIDDPRIRFFKGLFQETLPDALDEIDFTTKLIVHIDSDLYSSALFCLSTLYARLKPDDIVVFDEFGVPLGEFKAFDDITSAFGCRLEPIGAINNYLQVAFRVVNAQSDVATR